MDRQKARHKRRARRKQHVRRKLSGSAERPRLSVFRSNKHIYCQVIDDMQGKTLLSLSTRAKAVQASLGDARAKVPAATREGATVVGKMLAEQAREKGISEVVFDRNGYRYHGRVEALATAAREAGLKF